MTDNSGFLEEKALPSAGVVTFYQNLVCTFMNWCYNDLPTNSTTRARFDEELELQKYIHFVWMFNESKLTGSKSQVGNLGGGTERTALGRPRSTAGCGKLI